MNLLAIAIENNPDKLQFLLKKQIQSFKNEGVEIDEKIIIDEPFYILEYSIKTESIKNYPINDFINIFKYCVANALYEYIKLYQESELFNRIIEYDYYYFTVKERLEIQDNIKGLLIKDKNDIKNKNNESYQRKFTIIQRFVDYFKENTELNLKGFITFRLKDYILELQDIVERAVEDLLMDKEYNEFIKLLKYFVDIQEAKIDVIHIVIEEDNKYKLYDQYSNIVNNEYLKMIAAEMTDKDINYEDLLISSLITIAPNKVFIHRVSKNSNAEVIKTISRVFADRVKVCDTCDWCKVKVQAEKE
ncbi:putative sporulation protein YtxC [Natronincola peptidivorans]|uniref:Putative sporulation protein YtxC n=1 Tax=Natronincola peptidivorans TaxID=426128 RepID=A0A1I0EVC0_9FIRM|nr:putative sporulation protein YtxC [Natronincola peptidivorans]SET49576.1 putative sporulation protein YtxC [Natronincola peptidivorans]